MKLKTVKSFARESFFHWFNNNASRRGAALSYYTIFSLIPLLSLVIYLSSVLFSHIDIKNILLRELTEVSGVTGVSFIRPFIENTTFAAQDLLSGIISFGLLIVGSIGVLYELKRSLDEFWNTPQDTSGFSLKRYIRSRALALSIIPILVILFITSLLATTILTALSQHLHVFAHIQFIFEILNTIFSFIIITLLFTFIYKFLPKISLPWKEIISGALFTSLLFGIGRFVISFYISTIAQVSIFGTAAALIAMLLWVYFSVQIFFFGASLIYVYSKRYGYLKQNSDSL